RVEAGREDDRVELERRLRRAYPGRRDRLDRVVAQVDERHVRPVEGRVVARVYAEPLAADHLRRLELLRDRGVAHDRADLAAHELGCGVVRAPVDDEIGERSEEAEAAALPALLVFAVELLRRERERWARVEREVRAERLLRVARAEGLEVGADLALVGG